MFEKTGNSVPKDDPSRCYYSRYITSLLPPQLFDGSAAFWMYALHIMYPALNFNYPARMKFETVVAGAVGAIEHLPRV